MSGEVDTSADPHTDPDRDRVPFEAPQQPFRREECIRIRLPGVDQPASRAERPVVAPLVRAIEDVFEANAGIDLLELLSFPGPDHQEFVLQGVPRGVTETGQATLDQATGGRSIPGTIATRLDTRLPEAYGLERATLRLDTIGLAPVPTCRLVLPSDRTVTARANLGFTPVVRALRALHDAGVAHLYQVLLRPHGGREVTVSVRLAPFLRGRSVETDADFVRHVERDHPYDLAAVFGPAGLSSNFQLPIGRYYYIRYQPEHDRTRLRPRTHAYGGPERYETGQAVRELCTGHTEYEALLQGRDCYDEAYVEALGYPKFTVTPGQLANLVGVVPLYHESDPWARSSYRPPTCLTEGLVAEVAGTAQSFGGDPDPAAMGGAAPVANEGGATHQSLVEFAAQWFEEQGYDVTTIEQDTASRPDLRLHETADSGEAADSTIAVEVESGNRSKAANLLANVARAVHRDRSVTVVTESREAARWAANRVREPFKRATDSATQLYNWTAPVRLAAADVDDPPDEQAAANAGHADPRPERSDAIPLLPAGVDEAAWWLTPAGRLELTTPDRERTLAAGAATAGTASYAYDTPRYRVVDGEHAVVDADGDRLTDYASKSALTDDWTLVRQPHVPTRLSYLGHVRFRYQAGRALERFRPTADWDVEKNSDRYAGAVETFLDRYTVAHEGAEIPKAAFRERCLAWYRQLTAREAPGPMWFGRAMPDTVATKARQEDGGKREFLADRAWRYPEGLVSPDLPGIATGDDGSGDATDTGSD